MPRFRSFQRRRGNGLVEAALVLMPLLLVIIGILDFGQLLFLHQTFTERARAGVRWSITNSYDTQQIKNLCCTTQSQCAWGGVRRSCLD